MSIFKKFKQGIRDFFYLDNEMLDTGKRRCGNCVNFCEGRQGSFGICTVNKIHRFPFPDDEAKYCWLYITRKE